LNIFDQTIQPIAISVSFFSAAVTEAANSGKLVHIATIVRPIKASLQPKLLAIFVAESTIKFHQYISHINQIII
jgi:hypothetical protein